MMQIRAVDFLRGGAALLVLLAHVNLIVDKMLFHGMFIQGWCMVDLFFILSGFLTVWTYREETSPLMYCKKRFSRIYPTYWIYSFIVIMANLAIKIITDWTFVDWIDMSISGIARSIFLIPTNVAVNEMPVIPTAWTLSYEILFYIVSIILYAYGKRVYYAVVLFWASAIVFNLIFKSGNLYISFVLSVFFLEFFAGILTAEIIQRKMFTMTSSAISVISGIILLLVSWISENFGILLLNRVIKFGIPFALILYGLCSFEQLNLEFLKKEKICCFHVLSKISFSLYLIHYPMIVLLKIIFRKIGIPTFISFIIILPLCVVAAYTVNAVIESPITRLLNKNMHISKNK